jgi:hypothetical protein
MLRIPNDLNDREIRQEYKQNHKKWFLKNHAADQQAFEIAFREKYGTRDVQYELFTEDVAEQCDARGAADSAVSSGKPSPAAR